MRDRLFRRGGHSLLGALLLLAGCPALTPPRPKLYHMGERAEAGSLIYSVLEAEWRARLGEDRVAKDRFLILRITVTNSGASQAVIPGMQMVAPGGESYGEQTNGVGVPEWLGMLRRIEPAETVHGRIIFDLPRGDYRLRVSDDAPDAGPAAVAFIEVPLRFESKPAATAAPAPDL